MDNPDNAEKEDQHGLHTTSLPTAPSSAGVKMDTSAGMTVVLFHGHTHKSNFHHQGQS